MTSSFSQLGFVLIVFAFFSVPLVAAEKMSPLSIPGVDTLDAEGLISLANSFDDLVVIDSRIAGDRRLGFLSEAHSLSDADTNCQSLKNINPNTQRNMVFYSRNVSCLRSSNAVNIARDCGYQQLYWFRGGFEEWRIKDYPYVLE